MHNWHNSWAQQQGGEFPEPDPNILTLILSKINTPWFFRGQIAEPQEELFEYASGHVWSVHSAWYHWRKLQTSSPIHSSRIMSYMSLSSKKDPDGTI